MPTITLIAAVDRQNAIGKNGELPWYIQADMDHFRKTTTDNTVIMGRKTWESIPAKWRPLKNRNNIVITRNENYVADGALVVGSIEEAIIEAEKFDVNIFVIGGAEIYAASISMADMLLITKVNQTVVGADAFFPKIDIDDWVITETKEIINGNDMLSIDTYTRIEQPITTIRNMDFQGAVDSIGNFGLIALLFTIICIILGA